MQRSATAATVERDLRAALALPLAATSLRERPVAAVTWDAGRQAELERAVAAAELLHHEVDRLHREVARRDAELAALRHGG